MSTVLVVDDDRVLSHLVGSLLREKGYKIIPAFDAVQAMMVAMKPLVPEELFQALATALV